MRKEVWDAGTIREPRDLIGQSIYNIAGPGSGHHVVVARWLKTLGLDPPTLVGFENHSGRTFLGEKARPLGRVRKGRGNNGSDGHEGARDRGVIGTYLHGPLLPKNAWFADWLIETALRRERPLKPLDDELEATAHADARRAAGV